MSTFKKSRNLKKLLIGLGFALWSFCISIAVHAQPLTVTITQLEQLGGIEGDGSWGDFYAKVTINGTPHDNFDQHLDYPLDPFTVYLIPSGPLLNGTWVLTQDVPSDLGTVPVRIEIIDDDSFSGNDRADINPSSTKEVVDLTVDLTTGRWSGDISWPQSCVAGRVNDDKAAGICFDVSVISPSGDADGDGLLDGWEQNGYNDQSSVLDADSTIDVDLPAFGANPLRKDIFVEVDCLVDDVNGNGVLETQDHSHCPKQDAIADVVQAFADASATVSNPDGTTGVQLHVDVGHLYGAGIIVSVAGTGGVSGTYGDLGGGGDQIAEAGNEVIESFWSPKGNGTAFADLRKDFFDSTRTLIFRYAIFGHQTNGRQAVNDCTSGETQAVPGVNFFVTLGGIKDNGDPCWRTISSLDPCFVSGDTGVDAGGHSVGNRKVQAGTFMHELGHTLGLQHDGDQDNFDYGGSQGVLEVYNKPNYLSVMNYVFQCSSVPSNPAWGLPGGADYSRLKLDSLDETRLDECAGQDAGVYGLGPMDWNGTGGFQGTTCSAPNDSNIEADTNNDGVCVEPGGDGSLDTTKTGDDSQGTNITDGGNRVCNTTADTTPANIDFDGVDVQVTAVGITPYQPNVLTGFDDWGSHLFIGPLNVRGFGSSGSLPVTDEADPDTIRDSQQNLSEIVAPAVVVDKTGPATAVPGDLLNYAVKITNEGRGPALSSILTDTAPDGTVQTSDLGVIPVGSEKNQTSSFTVPADACPGDFTVASASLAFKDFVGRGLTATDSVPLQIQDVAAPTLSVSMSPSILWPAPNHKLVVVTATVQVEDNCDSSPAITLVSVTSNESAVGYIGTGDQGPDIQGTDIGTDDRSFSLRAERATFDKSTGRVYTIVYQATDTSGNTSQATTTVTVPKDSSDQ
jgi:uncharacterized repeat protein (TIGR01451 family)